MLCSVTLSQKQQTRQVHMLQKILEISKYTNLLTCNLHQFTMYFDLKNHLRSSAGISILMYDPLNFKRSLIVISINWYMVLINIGTYCCLRILDIVDISINI